MLSANNADLICRDTGLPGLPVLLDQKVFTGILRDRLPDIKIESAQIAYIRYKPGINCLVMYRLATARGRFDIYAKALHPEEVGKLRKAKEKECMPGELGIDSDILDDIGVVLFSFPNDRKLPSLKLLGADKSRRELFARLFPRRPDVGEGKVTILGYKPERRYVCLLETKQGFRAVLKFYTEDGYRVAYQNNSAFKSGGNLRLPVKIGRSKRHHIMAFRYMEGYPLQEAISGPEIRLDVMESAGAALARLHMQKTEKLAYRTREDEINILVNLARGVELLSPRLAVKIRRITDRQIEWLMKEPPVYLPIHGDFYARQVIVTEKKIGILDLDKAVYGDPRSDIGLFIAHLEHDILLKDCITAEKVAAVSEAMLAGYRGLNRDQSVADLHLYVAIGLLQLSHHPFRFGDPQWEHMVESILDRVETIMGKLLSGKERSTGRGPAPSPSVVVEDRYNSGSDPRMHFMGYALEPGRAAHYLSQLLRWNNIVPDTVRLRSIQVVRYRPERRCLVEYTIDTARQGGQSGEMTLLGKARAKGIDKKTFTICKTLWESGFDDRCVDGVSVPEPVGMIPQLNMWFQRKVIGRSATKLLSEEGGVQLVIRIADAIHKLHAANIQVKRRHTLKDELRILGERLGVVMVERPDWRGRINRVLEMCQDLASTLTESETTGIHRDFYADHVIIAGERIYLVDLDLFCKGDPVIDVGNFIAHIREKALRELGDPDALRPQEEAFVDRYLDISGHPDRSGVEIYTMISLVRHIWISSVKIPKRRACSEDILKLCERLLQRYG